MIFSPLVFASLSLSFTLSCWSVREREIYSFYGPIKSELKKKSDPDSTTLSCTWELVKQRSLEIFFVYSPYNLYFNTVHNKFVALKSGVFIDSTFSALVFTLGKLQPP